MMHHSEYLGRPACAHPARRLVEDAVWSECVDCGFRSLERGASLAYVRVDRELLQELLEEEPRRAMVLSLERHADGTLELVFQDPDESTDRSE
jgi:hypothetical protein